MGEVKRKVLYRLYPTPKQESALKYFFEIYRIYYNESRQRRIDIYKTTKKSISFATQCRETTELRKTVPQLAECNAQSLQVMLKRLDLGFQSFFRRLKNPKPNEKPGFPRYKTELAFKGWGYKAHGNGWRFITTGKRKASLTLTGIGTIKTRGKARNEGEPKTMEIIKRNNKWYASVTIICNPKRSHGTKTQAYDWGLKILLTIVDSDGNVTRVANPRLMKQKIKKIKTKQNKLKRKEKGSRRGAKLKKEIANIYEKACNQRTDFLHKLSASLVAESKEIITEELNIISMVMDHSKQNSRGLHRSILDSAPAMLNSMVCTKAQEAVCIYHEVETMIVKPTQRCSQCWNVEPKDLKIRTHICKMCGFTCDRDENSALVMLKLFKKSKGLALQGVTGQPVATNCETPSIIATAI